MSNKYPLAPKIPTLAEETPIRSHNGFVFSNPAYHARHDDLWPPKAGVQPPDQWIRDSVDLYLGNFCRPVVSIAKEVRCVACNADLTAPYGTDQKWAMHSTPLKIDYQSGSHEARCGGCGYPVRCKHIISPPPPRPMLPPLVKLDFFPLCYHPSATDRKGLLQ